MSKAKRITQKRLDNLRLEVELDNINQNANLTMAPIKQQMLKPYDMKYLVSGDERPQLGFDANVLDVGGDEVFIRDIEQTVGYQDPITTAISDDEVERLALEKTDKIRPTKQMVERLAGEHPEFQQFLDEVKAEASQDGGRDLEIRNRVNAIFGKNETKQRVLGIYYNVVAIPRYSQQQAQERADIEANNERLFKEQNSRYVKRIQNTNLGAYSTQKLEGESDENYIQRMQSLKASLPSPDRAVAMEKEKEKLQFRSYLSAVASPTVAETIINNEFFKGEDGERHVRLLVRAWPSFLKELKETYSKLDVPSFLEFAQSWVDKIETTKGVKNPVNADPKVIVDSGRDYRDLARRLNHTTIEIRNASGDTQKLTPTKKVGWKSFEKYPEFWELFTEINRDGKRVALQALYVQGFATLQREIDPIPQAVAAADVDNDGDGGGGAGAEERKDGNGFKRHHVGKPVPKHRKKYGHGISAKTDEPEYREFGRLIVSMPKLSDGILRVLYASNGINIAGIKSTHISEDFKDLIMTIIDTGKFNARLFDRLPNSEKPLFKKLIDVAKLKHKLGAGNLVDENEKQQLQRWELVRGELESGNDNISLKKEAKKLITYFMKSGRLSKSEAYDLLIQLSL